MSADPLHFPALFRFLYAVANDTEANGEPWHKTATMRALVVLDVWGGATNQAAAALALEENAGGFKETADEAYERELALMDVANEKMARSLEELIRRIDADESGRIDRDELKYAIKTMPDVVELIRGSSVLYPLLSWWRFGRVFKDLCRMDPGNVARVRKGEKIAEANGFVSVPLHAPTSGTIA